MANETMISTKSKTGLLTGIAIGVAITAIFGFAAANLILKAPTAKITSSTANVIALPAGSGICAGTGATRSCISPCTSCSVNNGSRMVSGCCCPETDATNAYSYVL